MKTELVIISKYPESFLDRLKHMVNISYTVGKFFAFVFI